MKQALVYCLVLNHNGVDVLEECLTSLSRQNYQPYKIMVIDNNSNDGSILTIKEQFPNVELLQLNKNCGFGRAYNRALQAIEAKKTEYIAFLNSDVVLEPQWLPSTVRCFTDHSCDCVQTIITDYHDYKKIDSFGIFVTRHLIFGDKGHGKVASLPFTVDSPPFGPSFAAVLLRKNVVETLQETGDFFDQQLNTFLEDVDISFRLHYHGFSTYVHPQPLCHHWRSFTADKYPFTKYFMIGRNYFLVLFKHLDNSIIRDHWLRIFTHRLTFLKGTMKHPVYFLGFLSGSLWGLMRALLMKNSDTIVSSTKRERKEKLIRDILAGDYE
ncbi:glycosyltransferase family 2 protein [candidate division CSSED10-310 bacterium]|uniref:Glycosyltransferase family 2 protein n=1 Tax=candidate division CSSED10-310 bacterium TaxID=2855610 RepID=A0ABV6YQX1_UNCC1